MITQARFNALLSYIHDKNRLFVYFCQLALVSGKNVNQLRNALSIAWRYLVNFQRARSFITTLTWQGIDVLVLILCKTDLLTVLFLRNHGEYCNMNIFSFKTSVIEPYNQISHGNRTVSQFAKNFSFCAFECFVQSFRKLWTSARPLTNRISH